LNLVLVLVIHTLCVCDNVGLVGVGVVVMGVVVGAGVGAGVVGAAVEARVAGVGEVEMVVAVVFVVWWSFSFILVRDVSFLSDDKLVLDIELFI